MDETIEEEKQELSDAQIAEMRKKTLLFYKDQNPVLKAQAEHEELKARIDKARYEGLEARVKYVRLTAGISQDMSAMPENPEVKEEEKLSEESPKTD